MINNKFINPAPYGEMKFDGEKTANLIAYPNSKLISPYDGIVVFDQTPRCEDSITIKHNFKDNIVYSVFCGVKQKRVSYNTDVRQGNIIGLFGDDKIKYTILDSDDKKQLLAKFYYNDLTKDDDKKEKNKKDKEKTTTTTTTLKLSNTDYPNPFMDILLSPFTVASNLSKEIKKDVKQVFSKEKKDKDKDKEDDEKKLNENIKRIKKLIK